jgi:hypothetical protein
MNYSQHAILFLIALLTCFIINNYNNNCNYNIVNKENFITYSPTDSTYANIGTFGIDNSEKTIPLHKYANQIAYDLQNPFPNSTTGNNKILWNPASYREVQEPDGQFVGIISPN